MCRAQETPVEGPDCGEALVLAAMIRRKVLAGISAIIVMGGTPDMLDPLLTGHRLDRPALALGDCLAHGIGEARIGQIAIDVEEPRRAVVSESIEDTGDTAGQEFAHGKLVAAYSERR
jgi:hypothetical protein